MGRLRKYGPPSGVSTCDCSACNESRPATEFYWKPDGSRRHYWCASCFAAYNQRRIAPAVAAGAYKTRPAVIACAGCGCDIETNMRNSTQQRCAPCAKALVDFKTMLRNALDKADRVAAMWAAPPKVCPHCGTEFRNIKTNAVYCSEKCNSSAHGSKRANGRLPRGSGRRRDIQRAYIIQRDKSTCYLCGEVCSPAEIHLDHVVPLSRGGSHDESNLRVSCAPCNLSKGASARGEQLLLIG